MVHRLYGWAHKCRVPMREQSPGFFEQGCDFFRLATSRQESAFGRVGGFQFDAAGVEAVGKYGVMPVIACGYGG